MLYIAGYSNGVMLFQIEKNREVLSVIQHSAIMFVKISVFYWILLQ
jgi:hypothetical protein